MMFYIVNLDDIDMSLFNKKFFLLVIIMILMACSPRLIKYNRSLKKFNNYEITREDFDEDFYSFYDPQKKYSNDDTLVSLKFDGIYVNQDWDGKYRAYKFFPSGVAERSYKMDSYPNNINILTISKERSYYRIKEKKIVELEYLISRDWSLHNIIKSGVIKGNILSFYQTKNSRQFSSIKEIQEVYTYDSTISMW